MSTYTPPPYYWWPVTATATSVGTISDNYADVLGTYLHWRATIERQRHEQLAKELAGRG